MAADMTLTFLGTSSGGGPSESRNSSSLLLSLLGTGKLWMVDCAEGTTRQFYFQPPGSHFLKATSVSRIFITHMHADHVGGLLGFLRQNLFPPSIHPNSSFPPSSQPRVEIYGPAGIRLFIRQMFKMTLTRTGERYIVHELLNNDDVPTPCEPPEVLHSSEIVGRDIRCSEDGLWRSFTQAQGTFGDVVVDAGPILHRDPCIGYVFRESKAPGRKIVVLGDTYDPSAIIPLAKNPSLLIHEATDAHIAPQLLPNNQRPRSPDTVLRTALARGHSTPQMAGEFAKTIGAEKLVLNHIGGRFPAPRHDRDPRIKVMREIERQATEAWGSGRSAMAAWDFLRVTVPAPDAMPPPEQPYSAIEPVAYADPKEGLLYVNQKKRKW